MVTHRTRWSGRFWRGLVGRGRENLRAGGRLRFRVSVARFTRSRDVNAPRSVTAIPIALRAELVPVRAGPFRRTDCLEIQPVRVRPYALKWHVSTFGGGGRPAPRRVRCVTARAWSRGTRRRQATPTAARLPSHSPLSCPERDRRRVSGQGRAPEQPAPCPAVAR